MSSSTPTSTPRPTKDWTEEDDSDEDGALREAFASPTKATQRDQEEELEPASPSKPTATEDAPVASLLSRISGLSTDAPAFTPSQPSSSTPPPTQPKTRPTPNTSNPLFGRALAGVKTERTSAPTPVEPKTPAKVEGKEEGQKGKELLPGKEGKMSNFMDNNDGWGDNSAAAQNGKVDDGWGGTGGSNGNENGQDKNGDGLVDTSMSESGASGLISNDFQVEVKLADQQADPNSPLYSVKQFEQLPIHKDLLKGIYGVGFKKPSKIQEKALPMLLNNPPRNLIGQSQSGTGKTAAFTLNMLSRVDPNLETPQAICLAPSRELARQIQEVVDKIGQFTTIKSMLAVPGSWSRHQRIDKHILIGTPGTIVDMLSRSGKIFDPKMIRVFVLDEADQMIQQQGHGDQTTRIQRMLPRGVQNVLFSATFPEDVQRFAAEFAPEANQLFLKQEEVTVDAIAQLYLECNGEEQKYDALSALYDVMTIGQSIVFCKRRDTADRIAKMLQDEGHGVASLHGEKEHGERDAILDEFRNGNTKVLITTNVLARGIDIQQVNMVVNYDVPVTDANDGYRPDLETYIHRIGRTGRFGRKGCSVIFVHDQRSKDEVNELMSRQGRQMKRIDASKEADLQQLGKALKAALGTTVTE